MAMGRPKAELVLSVGQREQLESLANSRSLPAGLVMRARIILLSAAGKPILVKRSRTDSSGDLNACLGLSQSGRRIKRLSTSRTPRTNPVRRPRLVCLNH